MTFKLKTVYHLELLTPETMKLLRSNKNRLKKKTSENLRHLDITEVILVHCNIVILIEESWLNLFLISQLVNY